VDITMSNFRYCRAEQCLPIEINYVRNPTGNGLIHKNALAATFIFRTEVNPGDTVVWTYKDSFCDMLDGCTGHAVCFENGTAEGDCGNRFAASQSGATSFSFTVPATAKTGTLLRYFCNVNAHYLFGMTGALLVK
jgi:plastocyanin